VDPLNAADRAQPASRALPPSPPATPPVPPMPGAGLDPERRAPDERLAGRAGEKGARAGGGSSGGDGAAPGHKRSGERAALPAAVLAALAEPRGLGELLAALAVALVGAGDGDSEGDLAAAGPGREALGALLGHAADAGLDGPGLAQRVRACGTFHEALLARADATPHGDLKALALALAALAEAAAERAPEDVRAACAANVARAARDLVTGIVRGQWLDLCGRRTDAPRRTALPWFDDGGIGSLELVWPRGRSAGAGPFEVLLTRGSAAGPVVAAADLNLSGAKARISVRVVESEAEVMARARAAALAARIEALLGRPVEVEVACVPVREVRRFELTREQAGGGRGIVEVEA
jgi:hypothetical protein